ncbi:MAG: tetratricopeptide repeat protein, partial [Myxococcales bacterium]|nr:tetratricopeptide repeat protein [Myxococcales bacterium]
DFLPVLNDILMLKREEAAALADGGDLYDALAGAHRAYAGRLMAEGRCGAGRDQLLLAEALSRQVIADRKALFDCMQAHGEIDPETQINDLRRLLVLGDTRPEVRSPLMRLLLDAGRDDEAVVHAPALGRDLALTLEDHQRLAWAYARLGRLAEAEPHLLKVLQADPADLMARLKLAEVYEARGANGEARRALQALTVDHPDNPALWLRLAEHLQREGDAAGARAAHAEANRLRGITFEPRDLRPLKKSRH